MIGQENSNAFGNKHVRTSKACGKYEGEIKIFYNKTKLQAPDMLVTQYPLSSYVFTSTRISRQTYEEKNNCRVCKVLRKLDNVRLLPPLLSIS
jgi:hypothetical protein